MPRVATTNLITNPKRYGYDCQLDNIYLRTAVAPGREMTIQSSDVQSGQNINVKQNPEDFTSNLGRIYSRNNFRAGQGLDTAHRSDGQPDDTKRFWDSKGVDVFHGDGEQAYQVHLLHTTAVENASFTSTNNYLAQSQDGTLYVTNAKTILKSTDNGDTWAVVSTGLTINFNFTGICTVGNRVFAITANGTSGSELIEFDGTNWHERTTDQSSNAGLNFIGFFKGQLFITGDDGTVEYLWAVSPFNKTWSSSDLQEAAAVFTYENSHHISQMVDAGAVVLAGSTDGNIYSIKDNAGTMILKGQTNVPFEEIHSISASEGIIFFGTKEMSTTTGRLYRAELVTADDLYVLANRQLIKEWPYTGIDTTPTAMFASRDSIYMGVKESATESYMWRYYLPTAALARDLKMTATTSAKILGITNSNDKFVMSMAGVDIYRQTSTYESTGYIIMSAADFFTAEEKQFVGAEISTLNMPTNTEVELQYSTKFEDLDNPDSTNYVSAFTQISGVGDEEKQIAEVSRYIIGKVILKSTNGIDTPRVKSIQFRALARPELVVAQIPINISDRVERPGRKPLKVKGLGDSLYKSLRDKEGDSVTLEIFEPKEIIRGVVEQISYPIQSNEVVGSDTQYAIITVRGTRQPSLEDVTSIHTLGISAYGIMRYGA